MEGIALNLSAGPIINALGGVLLLILAALVLKVRPIRGRNGFLAAFCAGLGLWTIVFYLLSRDDPLMPFAAPLAGAAMLLSSVGLVGLAIVVPRRLAKSERTLLVAPAVVAAVGLVVTLWGTIVGIDAWMRATGVPSGERVQESILVGTYCIFASAAAGSLVLFALRSRTAADAHERSQIGFMAAAIAVYVGLVAGIFFLTPLIETQVIATAIALGIVFSVVVWLANTRQFEGSRQARNLALFSLAMVLVGMVAGAWLGGFSGAQGAGVYGIQRSLAILVFAYAILKHQLLGIDVKLRFAIKTSTVAAVFLAVLFIVANIAQNYFGGQYGVVVGGAAAGMLFFVMAPIQRAAERLAVKAVPIAANRVSVPVAVLPEDSPAEHEEMYRNAARLALKDRTITRAEEVQLFRLARGLHLAADRAHEILVEVERETPRGRST